MQHSKIKLSQFHLTDIMILYFLHVAMDISYEKCGVIKAFLKIFRTILVYSAGLVLTTPKIHSKQI